MGDLLKRFEGDANRPRLLETVSRQHLVGGDTELAQALVERGELVELGEGDHLVEQGGYDDDLFLVLAGSFEVIINGRHQAVRGSGEHLGEQAGVDPSRPRSATLIAKVPSLVLRITQAEFEHAVRDKPEVWKRLLLTVQARLEERNRRIGQANDIPRIFVISSKEGLDVAEQVHVNLDSDEIAVQLWDQGTFALGDYPIASLMDAIRAADFTVAVVGGDDLLISRGEASRAVRDNVHLEYGISLGILGRSRSILLVCAEGGVKLPSDLAGLTTERYRDKDADTMKRSVRKACIRIKDHIQLEGVFQDRRVD